VREREGGRERIQLVACNLPFFLDFICYKILSTDDEWLFAMLESEET
jgi:hypothetical protein